MATKAAGKSRDGKKRPVERKSQFSTPVDEEALEFIKAIEKFKEEKGRAFPTWSEVLQILKTLGYRKEESPEAP